MRERERGGLRQGRERGEVCEHQNEPCGLVLVVKTGRGARTSERARVGSFWCSRRGREREEVREHQNEPVWAHSGGRDREGCPNIRTSPCGLVLVLETRERKSGGARAPERATHGLVLVFETRERERGGARAPERAHAGM